MVLFRAACFFYYFTELVVPAFFPVLHLAFGSTVACAAAAAFLSAGAKLGGADGALREDHLLYGQIARGQPYGQAPAVTRRPLGLLVSYRPLALLPINFLKLDEVKSEGRVRLW